MHLHWLLLSYAIEISERFFLHHAEATCMVVSSKCRRISESEMVIMKEKMQRKYSMKLGEKNLEIEVYNITSYI